MKNNIVISSLLAISLALNSCIGSFTAFNNLREWNNQVTDNKMANELIFLALWVVPVYEILTFADLFILNSIEFWEGTNPLSMQEGEEQVKIIKNKKNTYKLIATKNQYHIEVLKGESQGQQIHMVYFESDKSWNLETEKGVYKKLASLEEGFRTAYLPESSTMKFDHSMSISQVKDRLEQEWCFYKNDSIQQASN